MSSKRTPRRTQQQRREESRRNLLDAATRLFGARGYSGTTMVDIGKEAGVSHGLVTYHFGTKKDVFKAVLEDIWAATEKLESARPLTKRGIERLCRLCEEYIRGSTGGKAGGRAIYIAITESISSTPELIDLTAKSDSVFRDAVSTALTEAIEDNEISADVDVTSQSILVVSLLRGVVLQHLVNAEAVELDATIEAAKRMIRSSLLAT